MIFFTSDEHIGHQNILTGWGNEQKARPFSSLEDMLEGMLENHNSVVGASDLVYHIGDMFWRTLSEQEGHKYLSKLHGQHYYIRGNHEEFIDKYPSIRSRFVWIKERAKIRPNKDLPSIVLDHFAGRTWDGSHRGSWQLYGHSHGELEEYGYSFDVGVDCNNYTPISLDEVVVRMRNKDWAKEKIA